MVFQTPPRTPPGSVHVEQGAGSALFTKDVHLRLRFVFRAIFSGRTKDSREQKFIKRTHVGQCPQLDVFLVSHGGLASLSASVYLLKGEEFAIDVVALGHVVFL